MVFKSLSPPFSKRSPCLITISIAAHYIQCRPYIPFDGGLIYSIFHSIIPPDLLFPLTVSAPVAVTSSAAMKTLWLVVLLVTLVGCIFILFALVAMCYRYRETAPTGRRGGESWPHQCHRVTVPAALDVDRNRLSAHESAAARVLPAWCDG